MDDLVKRLQKEANAFGPYAKTLYPTIMKDAAIELARLRAEVERRDRALERVMIGGNHLATWREDRWPDYELDGLAREQQCENALRILGATPGYDMWVCWSTIMQVRDDLAALAPAGKGG